MENQEKNGIIQKLTATKKRFISALVVAAIVLAVPITISMLNQQQDIRQRASGTSQECTILQEQVAILESIGECSTSNVCTEIRGYMEVNGCNDSNVSQVESLPGIASCSTSNTTCPTGYACMTSWSQTGQGVCFPQPIATLIPDPSCRVKPRYCDIGALGGFLFGCTPPTAGWCSTTTPTATPSATVTSTPGTTITATPSATSTPGVTVTSTPSATATNTPSPTRGPLNDVEKVFDFNDDGKLDELDLNILYAGFAKRKGD